LFCCWGSALISQWQKQTRSGLHLQGLRENRPGNRANPIIRKGTEKVQHSRAGVRRRQVRLVGPVDLSRQSSQDGLAGLQVPGVNMQGMVAAQEDSSLSTGLYRFVPIRLFLSNFCPMPGP
jgi:hypothetical protein